MSGYELLDSGDQRKLERFGEVVVDRPSAAAVWGRHRPTLWRDALSTFHRDASGRGRWEHGGELPAEWRMTYAEITWCLRPNDFGHLGVFPEQAGGWAWIDDTVRRHAGETEVLNLFGYTGGSTLRAARAGARVVHVDASKTSVRGARENAAASALDDLPIRWIVDDALRFVEREIRRERRYQGIVLDPPSYGRGPRGEIWKIEDQVGSLLEKCAQLLTDGDAFFLLSSHSPGFTPLVLANLLAPHARGEVEQGEMVVQEPDGRPLPSGAYARWRTES